MTHRQFFIEGATTHLRLRRGADSVTLRLFADPQRSRRVYLRAGDFGITHVEGVIPLNLAPDIAALQRALERGLDGLLALVAEGGPLAVLRATFDDQRVPHWPPSMRSGAGGAPLWPFDAELTGLALGLRRLIRREWLASDPARAEDERWLASNGLSCRSIPADEDRVVVLASDDASVLETACALEPHVERPSPQWEAAASQMGALLGYPPCCVRRFVAARARMHPRGQQATLRRRVAHPGARVRQVPRARDGRSGRLRRESQRAFVDVGVYPSEEVARSQEGHHCALQRASHDDLLLGELVGAINVDALPCTLAR